MKNKFKILILIFNFIFINSNNKVLSNNNNNNEIIINKLFDCRQPINECLHDGICSNNGLNCDCSPSPNWFGQQCELRRCVQLYNPCENGAACEKTEQTFKCHCPLGFEGKYCNKQLETVCNNLNNLNPCGEHGNCILGQNINEYICECHYGWTGINCSDINYCQLNDIFCLNGYCVNNNNTHNCECRNGWIGTNCDLDIDECYNNNNICQNGGKCINLKGSFYCECPPSFIGQFCERPNILDQCLPSPCLNDGICHLSMTATTSNWALNVEKFNWRWECNCPDGFEGEYCEKMIDRCKVGQMICVNGGQCVHPWIEILLNDNKTKLSNNNIQQKWHPSECKCMSGFSGEFCERDINECEVYSGLCQNGATCMNRHGSYLCLCVGGFEGKNCEINIDDCIDNICYSGSTCVDGISRYDCLCSPDRIGSLCEFPNPCFNTSNNNNGLCLNGKCYSDPEFGNYTCQCDEGWMGKNCDLDIDECAHQSTNKCFNGKCINSIGGFSCECEFGYTGELCYLLERHCDSNPCQNGGTCLNELGKYSCICLPGYSGINCEIRSYKELNKCYLDCQNGGICKNTNDKECECLPPFTGILCEIEKPDPCYQNRCEIGSVCAPNIDYISYTCQCPAYLSGQFCERKLAPCEDGYNPCVRGICHKNDEDIEHFICECLNGWTGTLCDKELEDENIKNKFSMQNCPLSLNPCQNGGQCIGGINKGDIKINKNNREHLPSSFSKTFFECICPRGFTGPLCENIPKLTKIGNENIDEQKRCNRGCRNGGKCVKNLKDAWTCLCPPGFQGSECENEMNICLNITCKHKGKCVNLGGVDFRCDCAPGWNGPICEINVDDCENIVCLNGGVCIDKVNNYICECARGFAGRHCEIFIPVDKFNRTDMVDMDNCHKQGCKQKAINGKCDPECNLYACQFDGGECSTSQINPFERCPQPSYCSHSFSNGKCDEVCNNERCLFDGFDCLPRPLAKCPRLSECALRYANGQCDQQCNMAACGWDGGDCDHDVEPESHVLLGELVLVLAVKPEELFPNLLRQFLLSLSSHLRVSLSLSVDEEGKPNLFHWTRDSGIGQRIDLPPGMNVTTMFSVHYYETDINEETNKNERQKRDLNDISLKEGVALFLRVDVTMCNLLDSSTLSTSMPKIINHQQIQEHSEHHQHRHHHHHIYHSNTEKLLGVHEPCFSHMDSVAAYVGAANAKKTLQDIGVPILSSEVRLPNNSSKSISFIWYMLVTLMFALVIGSVIIIRRPRNNKIKSAKTWRPPIVEQTNSKYGSSSTLASHQQLQQQTLRAPNILWSHYPVVSSNNNSCASSTIPLIHASSINNLSNQNNNNNSQNNQQQSQHFTANSMIQMAFQNNNNNNYQHILQQQNKFYRQHPLYIQQHLLQQSATLPRNNNNNNENYWTKSDNNNNNIATSQQYLNSSSPRQLIGNNYIGMTNTTLPLLNNHNNTNLQHISSGNDLNHYLSSQTTTIVTTTTSTINNNNNNSTCINSYSRCSSSGIGGSSTEHSPLGQLIPLHYSSIIEPSLILNNNNEEQKQRKKLIKQIGEFVISKQRGLIEINSEILSKLEPCIVNYKNERGRTFLHQIFQNILLMTSKDEKDLLLNIDLLFKSGISIDEQDDDGTTALSLAVRNRKFRTVCKLIIECNADANIADIDNKTPLYHLCANLIIDEDIKIAEFLINNVNNLQLDTLAHEAETPLIRCASLCNPYSLHVAELLINKVDASQRNEFINNCGKTLSTALHRAASVGNEQMIRLLVKYGANKEATDKDGKTPLFIAVEQAQFEAVSALLEIGADRNKADINDTKIMELVSQPGFEPISQLFRKFPENQNNNHQHISLFFSSSTRSSNNNTAKPNQQQQKNIEKQNNNKKQRVGTKRRNASNNTNSPSILQVIQRGVNSVLLPNSSTINNERNIYEDGSSAAKKRASIIPLTPCITNISPPCPPCYSSKQSLNNCKLLQNQQQQIPSSPIILPSIQQHQLSDDDNTAVVVEEFSSISSDIRPFFPVTTSNNNNTISHNYNNNGISLTNTTLVSESPLPPNVMAAYLL